MESVISQTAALGKSKAHCAGMINNLIRRGEGRAALTSTQEALESYPSDPYFLSHYGCLLATVERRPSDGVRLCEEAIKLLSRSMPEEVEFFYPIFYLNLGKAHLGANKKTKAMEAFKEGLKFAPRNAELLSELDRIGKRKPPVLGFLDRSHPVNIMLGRLRHKMTARKK